MTGAPRQHSAQQPPDPSADLTTFPARHVAAGTQWYRAHRVVPELVVMRPYDTPRAWAKAFFDAGFGGVWGMLRHSSGTCRGLSVFGAAGPRDWPGDPRPVLLSALLDDMTSISVVGPPTLAELPVVPPPADQSTAPRSP